MKVTLRELLSKLDDGLPVHGYDFNDDCESVASFDSDDDPYQESDEDEKFRTSLIDRAMANTGKIYGTLFDQAIARLKKEMNFTSDEVWSYLSDKRLLIEEFFEGAKEPLREAPPKKICRFRRSEEKQCDFSKKKEVTNNILLAIETIGLVESGTTKKVMDEYDEKVSNLALQTVIPPTAKILPPPQPHHDESVTDKIQEVQPTPPDIIEIAEKFRNSSFNISDAIFLANMDLVNESKVIQRMIAYNDEEATVSISRLKQFRIVYIPSGGGKTTLVRNNLKQMFSKYDEYEFYDVDDFIKDNYSSFREAQAVCSHLNNANFMNKWFKMTIMMNVKKFKHKILLFNHPNQFPNCFRQKFNELIVIPKTMNWNLRFFDENYFSLISVIGKDRIFLDYDEYQSAIMKHFKFNEPINITDSIRFSNSLRCN